MKKMNYLFIMMDVETTAPGVVYKKLLEAMVDDVKVFLVCPNRAFEINEKIEILSDCPVYKRLKYRLESFLYSILGTNIIDELWSRKTFRIFKSQLSRFKFDAVFSFVSCFNFAPIILGGRVSSFLNIPWVVYSVDAIPAPLEWDNNQRKRNNIIRRLNKRLSSADAFFSANPNMLEYELKLFPAFKGRSGVVLTPCDDFVPEATTRVIDKDRMNFVYLGNVYGARKIDSLLEGFKMFLEKESNAKMIFVGSIYSNALTKYQDLIKKGKIVKVGFVKDVEPYYNMADVLIDIGADIVNDVYLSSKIANYLPYSKPIVAITAEGSPARCLLSGEESIVHCHHNGREVFEAMMKTSEMKKNEVIINRESLIEKFTPHTVASNFLQQISEFAITVENND